MSLIFGFLDKTNFVRRSHNELGGGIRDLSLNGERNLYSLDFDNVVFSCVCQTGKEYLQIAENEDKSLMLIMGGRIFGFKRHTDELKTKGHRFLHSDSPAEFLLHAFEQYGSSCFKDVNGIYSVAVWDRKHNQLFIANDLFGFYPLFIADLPHVFIFCSEYQPILEYKKFKKTLNHDAIAEYFLAGVVLGNKTFFKGINRLPPASVLTCSRGRITLSQYECIHVPIQRGKTIKFFAKAIEETFRHAVKVRVASSHIERCDLSGGLDTRLILGSLSAAERSRFPFVTGQSAYLQRNEDKDVICAEILAEKLHLRHIIMKGSKPADFGSGYFDHIRPRHNNDGLRIAGVCGGELLGGVYQKLYPSFLCAYASRGFIRQQVNNYFSKSFIRNLGELDELYGYARVSNNAASQENSPLLTSIDLLNRSFFSTVYQGAFSGWLCRYQNFLSNRVFPYLDKEFLKALLSVPPEYVQDYRLYIEIMKIYHKDLLNIPCSSGACKHPFIKQPDNARHSFDVTKYKYHKFSVSCVRKPYAWWKRSHGRSYRKKVTLLMLDCIFQDGTSDKELIKFLDFQGWLWRYYISEGLL